MFDELEEVFHGRDDVTGLESVATTCIRTFGTWNEATRAGLLTIGIFPKCYQTDDRIFVWLAGMIFFLIRCFTGTSHEP